MINWNDKYATRAAFINASEIRDLFKLLEEDDILSFAGGFPDPKLLPGDDFREAYNAILRDGNAGLQYSLSEGFPPLRNWIAEHMKSLGVQCSIDNILITSGSQQALDFLAKLFLSPGDTVLVTRPTYLGALQVFNSFQARYAEMSLDLDEPVGSRPSQAKLAYVIPESSNPTGHSFTQQERLKALEVASACDVPIIEDAAYEALRYDGDRIPPILATEAGLNGGIDQCRTIYCGTFSKTLSPGMRIGWVVASQPLIEKLVLLKQAADLNSSALNQMVLHRVCSKIYDGHLNRIRSEYRRRRDNVLASLERYMPEEVTWTTPQGGMFIWVTLAPGFDCKCLLAEAITSKRVAFVPGQPFHVGGDGANTLRLSFTLATEELADEGIRRLAGLVRQARPMGLSSSFGYIARDAV